MLAVDVNTSYAIDRNLAIRAVRCANFRWIPGMQTRDGDRVLMVGSEDHSPKIARWRMGGADAPYSSSVIWKFDSIDMEALPDLSDPGTVGCLLSLVRELLDDPDAYMEKKTDGIDPGWMLWVRGRGYYAESEAEVLVMALEISAKINKTAMEQEYAF
jgi:hypothetical protein